MPKLGRKEASELVSKYAERFETLIDKDITIALGPHRLETHIYGVSLGRQSDVRNLPEKVLFSGARYTPSLMCLDCGSDGNIFFVLEDIKDIFTTLSGVDVIMTNQQVQLTER